MESMYHCATARTTAVPAQATAYKQVRRYCRVETLVLISGLGLVVASCVALYLMGLFGSAAGAIPRNVTVRDTTVPVSFFATPRCTLWAAYAVAVFLSVHIVRRRLPYADPLLLPLAGTLMALGVVWQMRLAPFIAQRHSNLALLTVPDKQLVWATLAIIVAAIIAGLFNEKRCAAIRDLKYLCVIAAAVAVVLTFLFGHEINNRRLWFRIAGITIQTVEFVKVLVVIFLSAYLAEKGPYITSRRIGRIALPALPYFGPLVLMMLVALFPLFLQGDLGPTILLVGLLLAMFYLATSAATCVFGGLCVIVGVGVAMYWFDWPTIVRVRADMWLNPFGYSEHMANSLWAISAGGPLGAGLLRGFPESVPVVHSDFIFAAIAEEWGFVGAGLVLALIAAFVGAGYRVSAQCTDRFRALLAASVATLVGLQTIVIVGGVIGLVPVTGITMPFISYGGSAMLANGILLGILVGISELEGGRR